MPDPLIVRLAYGGQCIVWGVASTSSYLTRFCRLKMSDRRDMVGAESGGIHGQAMKSCTIIFHLLISRCHELCEDYITTEQVDVQC